MQILLPKLSENFRLTFTVEYSEEKAQTKASVLRHGEEFNPFEEGPVAGAYAKRVFGGRMEEGGKRIYQSG